MALVFDRVVEVADAIADLSNRTSQLLADVQRTLTLNSNVNADWNAAQTPSYITEDAALNINGRKFSRQDVGNAIGSLSALVSLLTNQSLTGLQGDHIGNVNKLARAESVQRIA